MACFSLLGAFDLIIGNKFGLGKQFERGLELLGTMALSMVGMIIIAPLISQLLFPFFKTLSTVIPFDPAVIAGSLLANDMGGYPLAMEFALTPESGNFNGLVVGAMMGATVSFTLPFALGAVPKEKHDSLMLGLMCGIVTVPVGCFVAGLIVRFPIEQMLLSLVPLLIFSAVLAVGLFKAPKVCVKIFKYLGVFIKTIILIGLASGIFEFLTGIKLIPHTENIQAGVDVIFSASAVMTGAFPLVYLLSRVLDKPMKAIGKKIGINATAAIGLVSTLATNVTALGNMKDMDEKGVVLNSAFAVSAAFTFAGHLAFTLSNNPDYVICVIIGKLIAGLTSLFVANFIYNKTHKTNEKPEFKEVNE